MSHEISIAADGKTYEMMYYGETPWHGHGQAIDHAATSEEALKLSGQDWTVEKVPIYIRQESDDFGRTNISPELKKYATVRSDKPAPDNALGIVGPSYVPIQNKDLYRLCDRIVGDGQACYHTAGVLQGGRRVWTMLKLPGGIMVTDNDVVEKYLVLTNPHDGSETARMFFTPIRVVCMNTLSAARRSTNITANVRHTGDINVKFEQAAELIGIASSVFDKTAEHYKTLRGYSLTSDKVAEYFATVFPSKVGAQRDFMAPRRAKATYLFEQGKGNDLPGTRGTAWAAYNAVTEWVDHAQFPKAAPAKRFEKSWWGVGNELRQRAFREAIKMATV